MSKIRSVENITFVNYEITPIDGAFKDSLYQHLLDNVWGQRGEAEEDIRVICNGPSGNDVTEIRYQFGDDFDDHLAQEIGQLIEKQIAVWIAKNSIQELSEA
jgi:hypothetical protein